MAQHRESNERFLSALIASAAAANDASMVELLSEHRVRYRRRVGEGCARRVRTMVRLGHYGEAVHDLGASLRRAPWSVTKSFASGARSMLTRPGGGTHA